jgi:VIT1/CCC1 family predicted Fe2+/Mn2+ transporter
MPTRDLPRAKAAYKDRDVARSRAAHDVHVPERHTQEHGRYIKSVVYGGLDGIVTTFAVVAGVKGADLSAGIVLILGFANLIADGLSMAIGDYLSTKAENEYNRAEREREIWEVENYAEGEKRELVELYVEKGIAEADAQTIVDIIARHKHAWIDIMMVEELGIVESDESPVQHAIATFMSFAVFGFVPLLAFVLAFFVEPLGVVTFPAACVLTGLTLFVLGAMKVLITGRKWLLSGFEMLLVGGLTAFAAYGIGWLLSGLAHGV